MTAEERAREHGKEMPCDTSGLEALAEEIVRVRPHPSGVRAILESVYRDGQSNPNAAAVAGVLRRASAAAIAHECGDEDDFICQGENCGSIISAAIEAMIPEPEPKEAGDE